MIPWGLILVTWGLVLIYIGIRLLRRNLKPKYRGCKYEMGFGHCWWSIAWDVPWDCPGCEKYQKKELKT